MYLIECTNGALYAGITNDVAARYAAHERGKGARFTRANPPRKLIGAREFPDRASAARAEYALKQFPRTKKIAFLLAAPDTPANTPADTLEAPGVTLNCAASFE